MTTNSQLSTNKPKRKTMKRKTKQTTTTGTESEKWTSREGLSVGRGKGAIRGERVQGRRSITGRHKIGRD